ncbi:MAG: hypothetical protein RLZZ123_2137 [Pseudomonadota bacterium]
MSALHMPSRWVIWYDRLASWLLWGVITVWVLLLALWWVLHGIIVPRIDEFRPWLQERATQAVGLQVELGPLSGQTRGLVTQLQMGQMRLLSAQGEPLLNLGRVQLALTPTSVLSGAFSQISLEQLVLDVARDADGKISIAGIPLQGEGADNRWRNWVFSQWEWVLRDSEIRWTDQTTDAPPIHMKRIEGVLRNGLRDHQFRIDGSPDAELGERLSWRGRLRQPLLSTQAGLWEDWSGQMYVEASRIDGGAWAKHWPAWAPTGAISGQAWLRGWIDVRAGQVSQWSADLGLNDVRARWHRDGQTDLELDLRHAQGRLGWAGGREEKWTLQQARLAPLGAPEWPVGQASLTLKRNGREVEGGSAQIEQVELASLTPWLAWAPPDWSAAWAKAAPSGQLRQLQWQWNGPLDAMRLQHWQAKALALSLQAGPPAQGSGLAAWPGVSGLSAELEGGAQDVKGQLRVQAGELNWPGLWEAPSQKIQLFKTDFSAGFGPEGQRLQLKSAQLQTEAAKADFRLTWRNSPQDPKGQMELSGDVAQAPVGEVLRWLPATLPESVRVYLKQAVTQGEVRQVQARVQGRLNDFPFKKPGSGEFRVSAQLAKVRYATVPRAIMATPPEGDWPVLQDLSAQLVFERQAMRLSQVKAKLAGAPGISWPVLDAQIKQLGQPTVEVRAEGRGPLGEALGIWKGSPLNAMTDRVLNGARATGLAEYRMNLSIPIERPENTVAKGTVVLQGNEVMMAPGAPTLNRARGTVAFTADGFDLQGMQAYLWGGDIRLEGGSKANVPPGAPQTQIRAQGQLSAPGLRDAPELAEWATHLKNMQGSAKYTARLQWRRGQLETDVRSDLVGMAISAPQGLGKTASETMPLQWESRLTAESSASNGLLQEQIWLRWGPGLEARYVRDLSGRQPKVLRGLIRWGSEASAQMPTQGVTLRVNSTRFNADEWTDWMQPFTSQPGSGSGGWDFAPQRIEFQAGQFQAQRRTLNQVQLNALRVGERWQGQVYAQELEGEWQYQPSQGREPAKLQARLGRLAIPASQPSQDNLLEGRVEDLPALDIQVRELDVRGKRLGSLALMAQNRPRPDGSNEWQLNQFQINNDEGEFRAQGHWRKPAGAAHSLTQLDFKLNVKNVGTLLQRMGVPDAVRNGHGVIEGLVSWDGSPMTPDLASIGGQFKIGIERGQFLKTEPGAARLLGVLSLQSLPRRLMFDFRDVFSEGFAFDFFRGDVKIERGVASSNNLQMKGVNVAVMMEGQAHIAQETQDLKVLVIPDINAGAASLVYSAINPVIGLTTFIAQYVLRKPLSESNTQQFHIDGTWSEPRVTQVPFKSDAKP